MRAMFYCQHVLGMGHLVRSLEIARALAGRFEVLFVSGGEAIPGIQVPPGVELVCLPGLQTDPKFGDLQSVSPQASVAQTKQERKQTLLDLLERTPCEVLVTEMFPFGRKQFEFELLPLLDVARQRGMLIASSVRDVLVRKSDQDSFERRVVDLVNSFYDLVLIHGDPRLLPFDESFSRLPDLACDVAYTGYVTQTGGGSPSSDRAAGDSRPSIVVSVGGGRCEEGHALLKAVLNSAPLLAHILPHRLDLFAGPCVPEEVFGELSALAAGQANVQLQKFTPNLTDRMRPADLSISMGGYNTVMNILRSGVRALVYTVVGNDREQDFRAARLENLNVLRVLRSLKPEPLVHQILDTLSFTPAALRVDLQGGEQTARLLAASLAGRAILLEPLCERAAV